MMKYPKVLVGCPVSDHKLYCIERYLKAVNNLTYPNFDILLVDNSENEKLYQKLKSDGVSIKRIEYVPLARERLVKSRNLLVERVLEGNYDYFFSLEVDVIPPKDIIERLLSHDKKIVSGVYFKPIKFKDQHGRKLKEEIMPIAYQKIQGNRVKRMTYADVRGDNLVQVHIVGLGCLMINKEVFEKKINFRYDAEKKIFDDTWFCLDSHEEGYGIHMDTSLKCIHLIKEMDWNKIKK